MKLVTFQLQSSKPSIGAVVDDTVVDFTQGWTNGPATMLDLIAGGMGVLEEARQRLETGRTMPLAGVHLLPPIPNPPTFMITGGNYQDHREEGGVTDRTEPLFANKQVSCVTGPYDTVIRPAISEQMDYEGELGVVVGLAGRNMTPERAQSAIFGYLVCNDLSIRDWQFRSQTITLGKSFDTCGPIGPWIVTADELPDLGQLTLTTTLNGQIRQQQSTGNMIYKCEELIAYLSQVMTLRPGSILATGTPAGVGLFRKPPEFLKSGDVISVSISGIGTITNRVIDEEQATA